MNFLWVFLGGGLGSMTRYAVSLLLVRSFQTYLPVATLTANLLASLVFVLAIGPWQESLERYAWLRPMLLVGFCGGFSTFSTFSYETWWLLRTGQPVWALTNVVVSVLLCVGCMWAVYRS